jgi:hypothetical protein
MREPPGTTIRFVSTTRYNTRWLRVRCCGTRCRCSASAQVCQTSSLIVKATWLRCGASAVSCALLPGAIGDGEEHGAWLGVRVAAKPRASDLIRAGVHARLLYAAWLCVLTGGGGFWRSVFFQMRNSSLLRICLESGSGDQTGCSRGKLRRLWSAATCCAFCVVSVIARYVSYARNAITGTIASAHDGLQTSSQCVEKYVYVLLVSKWDTGTFIEAYRLSTLQGVHPCRRSSSPRCV